MNEGSAAYTAFAQVYDLFMDNVPYQKWGDYIAEVLRKEGIADGLVLDLACGTGKLTRYLARKGYDMIGADVSADMLEVARGLQNSDGGILYLQQDMRSFELYGTVRAICCTCDSINYIMEAEELRRVFALANNYLDPGGLLIFDCNTRYKYETLLAENTFAENREEGSFIWENYFDPESGVNEYDLTLYIACGQNRYQRLEETHFQRLYELPKLQSLLEAAGMEFVAAYDGYSFEPPRSDSERLTVIARERGKKPAYNAGTG